MYLGHHCRRTGIYFSENSRETQVAGSAGTFDPIETATTEVARKIGRREKLTCDPWILSMIESYELDLLAEPSQDFRPKPLWLEHTMDVKLQSALQEFRE